MRSRGGFGTANVVVATLFLISAAVQLNDPDPVGWTAIYGSAAAACLVRRSSRHAWLLAGLVGLAALIWAATLTPVLAEFRPGDLFRSMKAETPSIEKSRELLGLLIVFAWMVVLIVVSRRTRAAAE